MLRLRVVSGAVLVIVVAGVFLLGRPWLTYGLALLAAVAASEVARLLRLAGFPADRAIVVLAAAAAVLLVGVPGSLTYAAAFGAVVVVAAGIAAFRRPDARDGFLGWMATVFGALYVALFASVAGILALAPPIPADAPLAATLDGGRVWLLILVLTVWAFDTFAFLAGRTFRRGRFLAHISPSKTWSGVIGGTVAALVVCPLLVVAAGGAAIGGLALGLVIAVCAQAGDVAESLLKRAAGAKDSGRLIPGHGGVLDRVDSFLFAAPAVFLYVLVADDLLRAVGLG
jgi:phosphatidate cytidylyltransferase